jgi:DNA-binding response OmpR family regulator
MVAGRNFDVFDRSIDMHVSSLRGKLGDDPAQRSADSFFN